MNDKIRPVRVETRDGATFLSVGAEPLVAVICPRCDVGSVIPKSRFCADALPCPGCGREMTFLIKLGGRRVHGDDLRILSDDIAGIEDVDAD